MGNILCHKAPPSHNIEKSNQNPIRNTVTTDIVMSTEINQALGATTSDTNDVITPSSTQISENQADLFFLGGDESLLVDHIPSIRDTSTISPSKLPRTILSADIGIELVPHVHTLFCERKERVCTAVGKVQELETLKVTGLESKIKDGACTSCWLRSNDSYQPPATAATAISIQSSFTSIPGSEGMLSYQLSGGDVGRYLCFQACVGNITYISTSILGPVLAGPPRMLELHITGAMRPGEVVRAAGRYIGGEEGESDYSWLRIRDGVRETISEFNAAGVIQQSYTIREDDVGCELKVKCRPVRCDGVRGEIFTSKASGVIEANEVIVSATIDNNISKDADSIAVVETVMENVSDS